MKRTREVWQTLQKGQHASEILETLKVIFVSNESVDLK